MLINTALLLFKMFFGETKFPVEKMTPKIKRNLVQKIFLNSEMIHKYCIFYVEVLKMLTGP